MSVVPNGLQGAWPHGAEGVVAVAAGGDGGVVVGGGGHEGGVPGPTAEMTERSVRGDVDACAVVHGVRLSLCALRDGVGGDGSLELRAADAARAVVVGPPDQLARGGVDRPVAQLH